MITFLIIALVVMFIAPAACAWVWHWWGNREWRRLARDIDRAKATALARRRPF